MLFSSLIDTKLHTKNQKNVRNGSEENSKKPNFWAKIEVFFQNGAISILFQRSKNAFF